MEEKIDIVICDHAREVVTFVKVSSGDLDKYDGDIERYISEFLEFKISECSWMSGTGMCVEMFGGLPNCGVKMNPGDYWDERD